MEEWETKEDDISHFLSSYMRSGGRLNNPEQSEKRRHLLETREKMNQAVNQFFERELLKLEELEASQTTAAHSRPESYTFSRHRHHSVMFSPTTTPPFFGPASPSPRPHQSDHDNSDSESSESESTSTNLIPNPKTEKRRSNSPAEVTDSDSDVGNKRRRITPSASGNESSQSPAASPVEETLSSVICSDPPLLCPFADPRHDSLEHTKCRDPAHALKFTWGNRSKWRRHVRSHYAAIQCPKCGKDEGDPTRAKKHARTCSGPFDEAKRLSELEIQRRDILLVDRQSIEAVKKVIEADCGREGCSCKNSNTEPAEPALLPLDTSNMLIQDGTGNYFQVPQHSTDVFPGYDYPMMDNLATETSCTTAYPPVSGIRTASAPLEFDPFHQLLQATVLGSSETDPFLGHMKTGVDGSDF